MVGVDLHHVAPTSVSSDAPRRNPPPPHLAARAVRRRRPRSRRRGVPRLGRGGRHRAVAGAAAAAHRATALALQRALGVRRQSAADLSRAAAGRRPAHRRRSPTVPRSPRDRVDFEAVAAWKERLLRASWEHFRREGDAALRDRLRDFAADARARRLARRLDALRALKDAPRRQAVERLAGAARPPRPGGARGRARTSCSPRSPTTASCSSSSSASGRGCAARAARRGIRLLGDLPIYVAADSADVWAHQELFDLDAERPAARRRRRAARLLQPRPASAGATRSTAGTRMAATATPGGSRACAPTSSSPTSCASTTSAASPRTGRSRPARRPRVDGRWVRGPRRAVLRRAARGLGGAAARRRRPRHHHRRTSRRCATAPGCRA